MTYRTLRIRIGRAIGAGRVAWNRTGMWVTSWRKTEGSVLSHRKPFIRRGRFLIDFVKWVSGGD